MNTSISPIYAAIARPTALALALLAAVAMAPVYAGNTNTCDLNNGNDIGEVDGGSDATGDVNSIACGKNNHADGNGSTAFGHQNFALGINSMAVGNDNHANFIGAHAFGGLNIVDGAGSIAAGISNKIISGSNNSAFGTANTVDGSKSSALGFGTFASGTGSVALGGLFDKDNDNGFILDVDTDGDNIPDASSELTRATGDFSTAIGSGSWATADLATAVGTGNVASGFASSAFGFHSTARGDNSIALGGFVDFNNNGSPDFDTDTDNDGIPDASTELTLASGTHATAIGPAAWATGARTIALGAGAFAFSDDSVALGSGSQADRANTVSVGSAGNERQIVNVAAGTEATDAVNLAQLEAKYVQATAYTDTAVALGGTAANAYTDNREEAIRGDMQAGDAQTLSAANAYTDQKFSQVDFSGINDRFDAIDRRFGQMDKQINRGNAMSAALAGMSANAVAGAGARGRIALGVGMQGGERAMSIGYGKHIGTRASFSLGGAFSGSEKAVNAGIGLDL